MRAPVLVDQEQLRISGARVRDQSNVADFGALEARALKSVAGDLQGFATEMDAIQLRTDEIDARKSLNDFEAYKRELLLNPETGFYNMKGENALQSRPAVEKGLTEKSKALAKALNGRSSRIFQDSIDRQMADELTRIDRHSATELDVLDKATREAQLTEFMNSAVAAYADEETVRAYISSGESVIGTMARDWGWRPEQEKLAMKNFFSSSMAGVITRLADDDSGAAGDLFDRVKGAMNAGDVSTVARTIRAGVMADRAREQVDVLLEQTGGDISASLSLAEDIENTDMRDEVVTRLLTQSRQREEAEVRDAENAEERARTAIGQGGVGAVRAADKAKLIREGTWGQILRDMVGSGETQKQQSAEVRDWVLSLASDDSEGFALVAGAIRGYKPPNGMTDAQFKERTGLSFEEARGLKSQLIGADYLKVQERHQFLSSQGSDEQTTLIEKVYGDLRTLAEPLAEAAGVDVTSQNSKAVERGAFRAYLYAQARDHVIRNGKAASAQELEELAKRALTKDGGWVGGRRAFQATAEKPVKIPYGKIPKDEIDDLDELWRYANPKAATSYDKAAKGSSARKAMETARRQFIEKYFNDEVNRPARGAGQYSRPEFAPAAPAPKGNTLYGPNDRPVVKTQEDFDALPSGQPFVDQFGKPGVKP